MAEEQAMQPEVKTEETPQQVKAAFDPKSFPLRAILGRKVGMTQIFSDSGQRIPVSVISTNSCTLTQIKSEQTDGYNAVQLGIGECKEKNLSKPYLEHFKKKNLTPLRYLKEFTVVNPEKFQVGQKLPAEIFSAGDYVDISGTSKGKGFAGVMKRHNFAGLPTSHGASDKVRSRGSSGGCSGSGQKVWKGTRMAGRMGSDWVTTQSIEVVKVDKENELLLIKGSIPGTSGSFVVVKETVKSLKHQKAPIAQKTSTKKAAVAAKKPAPKAAAAKK